MNSERKKRLERRKYSEFAGGAGLRPDIERPPQASEPVMRAYDRARLLRSEADKTKDYPVGDPRALEMREDLK